MKFAFAAQRLEKKLGPFDHERFPVFVGMFTRSEISKNMYTREHGGYVAVAFRVVCIT